MSKFLCGHRSSLPLSFTCLGVELLGHMHTSCLNFSAIVRLLFKVAAPYDLLTDGETEAQKGKVLCKAEC